MSTFTLRPFSAAVADLKKALPKLREQKPQHYDAVTAFAVGDLAKWPQHPPIQSLYQMKSPLAYSDKVLTDAKTLVEYANFGSAIGTWNAKGTATWACAPGDWIIAEVSLVQEQADDSDDGDDGEGGGGDRVAMLLAVWRIEEGAAASVLHREDRELLRTLIGLSAWPKLDQRSEVWYGE